MWDSIFLHGTPQFIELARVASDIKQLWRLRLHRATVMSDVLAEFDRCRFDACMHTHATGADL